MCASTRFPEAIPLRNIKTKSIVKALIFSPFELVFGHSVRGPLKLLKEKFLSNDEIPLNLLQYVSDLRNRLSRTCEVTRSNLKTSQGKMKARYDSHVIDSNLNQETKSLLFCQYLADLYRQDTLDPTLLTRKQVI